MVRSLYLLFGIVAYAVFFGTFLYLIGFVADLPGLPHTVDRPTAAPPPVAVVIDALLVAVFGLQHSVMARAGFKRMWTRWVPAPIERSTYMLFTCAALVLLFALWHPIPGTVWDARGTAFEPVLWGLFAVGWLIVLLSTFAQVWRAHRARPEGTPVFRQPFFYRLVRHPLYSGFFIAFWATPRMTFGHLLLAGGLSVYMLIAIEFEERDLVQLFGADYAAYRTRVGKLVPRIRRAG
jgi:methanethiol S-methyltransferase